MEFKQAGNIYIVRLDKGEELVETLQSLCEQAGIACGTVSGIGAINSVTMRFFDTTTKRYADHTINRNLEITSLLGNISQMNSQVYLHLHINVAGDDYRTFGGHLLAARISATAELIVQAFSVKSERCYSDEIGLNLLCFQPD